MNACFCNGIQNPPTWRVFLLEWVAVLRVEWVAGLVSLQVEGFDRYVWLSWGGIRSAGHLLLEQRPDGLPIRLVIIPDQIWRERPVTPAGAPVRPIDAGGARADG